MENYIELRNYEKKIEIKNLSYLRNREKIIFRAIKTINFDLPYIYYSISLLDLLSNEVEDYLDYEIIAFIIVKFLFRLKAKIIEPYNYRKLVSEFLKYIDYNLYIITPYNYLNNYNFKYNLDIDKMNKYIMASLLEINELPSKTFESCLYLLHDFPYTYKDVPELAMKINESLYKFGEENNYITRKHIFTENEIKLKIRENTKIEEKKWEIKDYISEGSYGEVYRSNNAVVKEITIYKSSVIEIMFLRFIEHPNIIKLFDVIKIDENVGLVLEEMDINLKQIFIIDNKNPYYDTYMKQTCNGILYLHQNLILHGDIKPENLLISSDRQILKICDFGLSLRTDIIDYNSNFLIQSGPFRAPEVFRNEKFGIEADIWSIGVLYAMIIQKKFYEIFGYIELEKNILERNYKLPENISHKDKEIILRCFEEKENRIKIEDLILLL